MNWALLSTSVALVIATAIYTWHTRSMATEMRAARLLAMSPKVVLAFEVIGPSHANLRIVNVGQGAARDVDVRIRSTALDEDRPWRSPLLQPGESNELFIRRGDAILSLQEAADLGVIYTMQGTAEDASGGVHSIDEELDVGLWWNAVTQAEQAYQRDRSAQVAEALERLVTEAEKIRKQLG